MPTATQNANDTVSTANRVRTFEQLSPDEQGWALGKSRVDLLRIIVEGGIRFEDQDLQGRIERALKEADRMQTPWFAHEYVMDEAGDDIRAMAQAEAESRRYAPQGVYVINVPSRLYQRGAPEKSAAPIAA